MFFGEVSVWAQPTAASQVQEGCGGRWTGQALQAHPVEALLPLAAPCRHSQSCPLPCSCEILGRCAAQLVRHLGVWP